MASSQAVSPPPTTAAEPADDAWYTVTGVRVTKPAAAGLYIHKGRKVVVR